MSSKYVVDEIVSFIGTNIPSETNVIDLSAEYDEIQDFRSKYGLGFKDVWLGIEFIGNDEEPIGLNATNSVGRYRETGSIYLHIVDIPSLAVAGKIRTRAETIRNAFRGTRIGDILIENVTPPNFQAGATLQFEGGYTSASVIINYQRDLNL